MGLASLCEFRKPTAVKDSRFRKVDVESPGNRRVLNNKIDSEKKKRSIASYDR